MARPHVLLALGLTLAGCAPKAVEAPAASSPASKGRLINAGGTGQDATSAFEAKGHSIVVEYKLSRPTSARQILLVLERETGAGLFERVSSLAEPLSGNLSGSRSIPLIPGRYRLRVETDVPWSAKIYEKES